MAKADIRVEEAKKWQSDVAEELKTVRKLLEQVHTALSEIPGTDDPIIMGVVKVGETMESAWSNLCDRFDFASDSLLDSINTIANTVVDLASSVTAVVGKIVH